jgi:hypothetical protein
VSGQRNSEIAGNALIKQNAQGSNERSSCLVLSAYSRIV